MASESGMTIGSILAELVTASGILRADLLEEARLHAQMSALPIGRVLVMSGHLGEGDLTSALQAAQMVREGKLTRRQATHILREAYNQCVPLHQIVDDLMEYTPSTKLGELLVGAQIVNTTTLSKLEPQAKNQNLTLGQILTRYGIISISLLADAVQVLILNRSKQLSLVQSAQILYACCSSEVKLEEAMHRVVGAVIPLADQTRIGKLLYKAGAITEEELLLAAEMGIESDTNIGSVLSSYSVIDQYVIDSAATLQSMLVSGSLNESQVVDLLKQVMARQLPIKEIFEELNQLKSRVVTLLKQANLVNDDDIAYSLQQFPAYADDTARALIAAKFVDLATVRKAVHCLKLIQINGENEEQVATALRHSNRDQISVEAALERLADQQQACSISSLGLSIVESMQDRLEPGQHATACSA